MSLLILVDGKLRLDSLQVPVLRLATTVAVVNMATVLGIHSHVPVIDTATTEETAAVISTIHVHRVNTS